LDSTLEYSSGDYNSLPADATILENAFTCQKYFDTKTDNNIYVQQCALNYPDPYSIFLVKKKNTDAKDIINIQLKVKTTIAASTSTVYLQIYNVNSGNWETLNSDSVAPANTEFNLTGKQDINLSDYYDGSFWVSCRLYQEASGL